MQKYSKAEAGKLGAEKSKITSALQKQERVIQYNHNPAHCNQCSALLDYADRHKTFCNSSCSATFNNLKRTEDIRKNPTSYKEKRLPVTWNCLNCNMEHTTVAWRIGKYCNGQCQRDFEYKYRVKQWLEEGKDWSGQVPKWAKQTLAELHGDCCSVCGIDEYNGLPIVLECDHIDGNHTNNSITNLRLICPNCHSQTITYKNKNKGNGRASRRILQ